MSSKFVGHFTGSDKLMKDKFFGIVLFTLLSCATSFGQSSFQEITPGTSTRDDVARALGQPVRSISATLFEYNPPAGITKVEVEYAEESALVGRIEVYLRKPISRRALITKFELPDDADTHETDKTGNLVEYFAGSELLVLTYAAADSSSGITRVGYYSRGFFGSAVSEKPATEEGVLDGKAISKPAPSSPPIAKYATGASGTVTVRVVVGESGRVISASAVSGHPLLRQAAVDAALQARFRPNVISGKPVRYSGDLTYNFRD